MYPLHMSVHIRFVFCSMRAIRDRTFELWIFATLKFLMGFQPAQVSVAPIAGIADKSG